MSPKQWLALLAFWLGYLFFGAIVFWVIEQQLETERRAEKLAERIVVNDLLTAYTAPDNKALQDDIFEKVSTYCDKPVTNYTMDEHVDPYIWTFYHSFFFCFTVISTVGYGNISPNNTFGRMFMIVYALVGIPLSGIMFAYMGDMFGKTFVKLYKRYKSYKSAASEHYTAYRFGLIGRIILYLVPGMIIFIFLPACLFTYFEGWPYTVSIYYAFVTLTTIGFGDYAASFQPHQPREFGAQFVCYEIFIIFWFIFGLGYLVMIMGFLGKGLRSKRIAHLEHQLALNLKETQHRIWHGVTKDVGYLRKMVNEMYLMKFKPVYHDKHEKFYFCEVPRSSSCPDLTIFKSGSPPPLRRRRTASEYLHQKRQDDDSGTGTSSATLTRVHSDSDLSRIDRVRTFSVTGEGMPLARDGIAAAFMQPVELLARVVTALGNIADEDGQSVLETASGSLQRGFNGFSDSQILASERTWSGWSLSGSEQSYGTLKAPRHRERALSEVKIPVPDEYDSSINGRSEPHEWTWSGGSPNQVREMDRMRRKAMKRNTPDLYRASFGVGQRLQRSEQPKSVPPVAQAPVALPITDTIEAANRTLLSRLRAPFARRLSKRHSLAGPELEAQAQTYLDRTANGRTSKVSLTRPVPVRSSARRTSMFTVPHKDDPDQQLLERTTIADLIRALEMFHGTAITGQGSTPRRKLGTASLTPPKIPPLLTIFSGLDAAQPPPYSATDRPTTAPKFQHRFSVRPSKLTIQPGQAPRPPSPVSTSAPAPAPAPGPISSSIHQRRLSARPSPLAGDGTTRASGRAMLWRPAQIQWEHGASGGNRTRHGSLSNLYEKRFDQLERKRTDSK